jgi:hypothetical protein
MLRKIPLTTALLALFAAGVLLGAACGDDDDDAGAQDGVSQEDFAALETQVSRNNVFAGMVGLSAIAFHAIDEDIQTATEIPEDYEFEVAAAQQVNAAIVWPEELAEQGEAFTDALDAFATAIDDGDLEAAKSAAAETHATFHDLEHDAWAYAAGEEHSEDDGHGGEEGEGDDHADETEGDDHGDDAEETPEG